MGEFFERWWPSIAGAVALTLAGLLLWPRSSTPSVGAERAPAAAPVGQAEPADAAPASEDVQRARVLEQARRDAELKTAAATQGTEPEDRAAPDGAQPTRQEPSRTVTLDQDSPEVRRALGKVEVELYETSWCKYCRKTRLFLDRSGIRYRAYDIEADQVAHARRAQMPGSGVPLTVVDGQIINGFSEEALNAAFQGAIQRRLASR